MKVKTCHAYYHRVRRSVLQCTEVKTAQSVCTEAYRSVRVLRRLNGVQEVASSVAKQSEDAQCRSSISPPRLLRNV